VWYFFIQSFHSSGPFENLNSQLSPGARSASALISLYRTPPNACLARGPNAKESASYVKLADFFHTGFSIPQNYCGSGQLFLAFSMASAWVFTILRRRDALPKLIYLKESLDELVV
jgi:hypothetical protein